MNELLPREPSTHTKNNRRSKQTLHDGGHPSGSHESIGTPTIGNIASATRGTDSESDTQNRIFTAVNSSFCECSFSNGCVGSSGMPHRGQSPGRSLSTPAHMGQNNEHASAVRYVLLLECRSVAKNNSSGRELSLRCEQTDRGSVDCKNKRFPRSSLQNGLSLHRHSFCKLDQ